eukprot:CAMPEP_0178499096 /NCGR_PEP_ID=MMETSP0696-20121128/15636_1 /TAXON_ID=265572 /ORGANISM="Extubocellulus spinifer, Strain CCMP396" /LENGTH=276 /DNA_ID=CAMNT_0020127759 /DNA_START=4 /DNA_END=834 /DNA_ORIENTATION=+
MTAPADKAAAAHGFLTPLTVVLPGDDLTNTILPSSKDDGKVSSKGGPPKLGPGLLYTAQTKRITATLAGRLYHRPSTRTYAVLSNKRRYIPQVGDRVLGIVEEGAGEFYRLNIHGPHPALLHNLSFEGATKRNRPILSPGALMYCRVTSVNGAMDPELSCKVGGDGAADGGARRRDWMTDEGTYGELKGGTVTRISLGLARELLKPTNVVLDALGKAGLAFEICVGTNGLVWIHSERPEYTVMIGTAIKNSEIMTEAQVRGMVKQLVATVRSSMEE